MTDRQPTPEALEAAISRWGSLSLKRRREFTVDAFALDLDDFAQQARDRALEEAAHYLENQVSGATDPLWSGSVAAEGIRALKPDWLDANRPKNR